MDFRIIVALVIAASAALTLAVLLVIVKLAHRQVQRGRGVRTAHYLAAVGEMSSRGLLPRRLPKGWASDTYFHDVLSDYRLLLTGPDRLFIDALAERLGVVDRLVARARRRFPAAPRLRAISNLVNLADSRHLPELRSLVQDRNPHVRAHAVRGLARLGDVASVATVLDLATRVKPWEAARVVDALVTMGAKTVPSIREWIAQEVSSSSPSVAVVALAARTLGLIGDPEAEPTLLDLLSSSQPEWRVAAASALEHTSTDAAVAPLIAALSDPEWQVRARAAASLGSLADPVATHAVAPMLTDAVWWVRQNAASALGNLPGGRAALVAALEGPDRYAADAAHNQLTISGAIAEATRRVENGAGTVADRALVARTAST